MKILAMPVDFGGCGWYRVRQPMQMIKSHTKHDTHVVDMKEDDMNEVSRALLNTDVVVVRQGGEEGIRQLKQIPEYKHLKYALDIDDNIEAISPYSEHYKEYGTQEFQDPDSGLWIWKDGEQGFDLTHNRARVASFLKGLSEFDLVTVTTEELADYARAYNPNVAICPNVVDLSTWWKLDFKPNEQLRVGWAGGVSHYEDWYTIKEPLNRLMRKYKFKLVSVGAHFPGIVEQDNRHLVEVWPWVPFKAHSYRMMCLALDIFIIPLSDLPFNRYKSSIKWYEASAMGVPAVVSDILPYSKDISPETALGYKSPEEFYSALELLLIAPQKRTQLGENARKWVEEHRSAKESTNWWIEAYQSLLT